MGWPILYLPCIIFDSNLLWVLLNLLIVLTLFIISSFAFCQKVGITGSDLADKVQLLTVRDILQVRLPFPMGFNITIIASFKCPLCFLCTEIVPGL